MIALLITCVALAWSAGYWQGRARRSYSSEPPVQHVTINNGPVVIQPAREVIFDAHGRYWQIEYRKVAHPLERRYSIDLELENVRYISGDDQ